MKPVILAGAGPGDPDLLTLRARTAIESSDFVFHDELVPPAILALAHGAVQPYESMEPLIQAARAGHAAVRLQIGDPSLYGKLTDEMDALRAAGIPFEIVPGVTAACAAAASAGISLTHRSLGRTVAFVTAHDPSVPLPQADTLVFYMGAKTFPKLPLLADTPAIAVMNASQENERIVRGTVATLGDLEPPAIIIVGAVAGLVCLPLYGRRIVVTRAESSRLTSILRAFGAEVIEYPVIEIVPPADDAALGEAIGRLAEYDWLIFTSANGARAFFDRLHDIRPLRAKLCTIGPATQAEVERHLLKVDVVPDEYVAESVVAALREHDLRGARVLLPRAAAARDVIPDELRKLGAQVDVVEAYRTIVPEHSLPVPFGADWITFTSSSTVRNFLALAGKEALNGARIASIGPITSDTLRKHGLTPTVEAAQFHVDGLVRAILEAN